MSEWRQDGPLEWSFRYTDARGGQVRVVADSYTHDASWRLRFWRNGTHIPNDLRVKRQRSYKSGEPKVVTRYGTGAAYALWPPPAVLDEVKQ